MKEIVVQYLLEAAVFIGLFIVGCIMIIVMTNKQIKTWIKTFIFLVISEGTAALVGWLALQAYCSGNSSGANICAVIAVILTIAFLLVGIKGHKNAWSHVDSLFKEDD